jgi:hypothetical protein
MNKYSLLIPQLLAQRSGGICGGRGKLLNVLYKANLAHLSNLPFKNFVCSGTVDLDGFFAPCILSRIERKDLKFFSCCSNIYWVRASINSFSA